MVSIDELLPFVKSGSVKDAGVDYKALMTDLKPVLDNLNTESSKADKDIDSLEASLLAIAQKLRATHKSLEENTGKKSTTVPPAATEARDLKLGVPPELNGGYKHSKRNSRKYMVKRFRSSRMSLKRSRKRRRKTLRKRSHRK